MYKTLYHFFWNEKTNIKSYRFYNSIYNGYCIKKNIRYIKEEKNKNNCCKPQHDKCKDKIYIIGTPGPRGRDGAGTVTVGTTTTGDAGTNASVTNTGTAQNAVLNFTIPRGETGATGPQGTTATNEYGYKYDTTTTPITLTANTVATVPLNQTGPLNVITGATTNALTIGSAGTYKIE